MFYFITFLDAGILKSVLKCWQHSVVRLRRKFYSANDSTLNPKVFQVFQGHGRNPVSPFLSALAARPFLAVLPRVQKVAASNSWLFLALASGESPLPQWRQPPVESSCLMSCVILIPCSVATNLGWLSWNLAMVSVAPAQRTRDSPQISIHFPNTGSFLYVSGW